MTNFRRGAVVFYSLVIALFCVYVPWQAGTREVTRPASYAPIWDPPAYVTYYSPNKSPQQSSNPYLPPNNSATSQPSVYDKFMNERKTLDQIFNDSTSEKPAQKMQLPVSRIDIMRILVQIIGATGVLVAVCIYHDMNVVNARKEQNQSLKG